MNSVALCTALVAAIFSAGCFREAEGQTCYSPRAICVPVALCPKIMGTIKVKKLSRAQKQDVWCRQCPGKEPSVFCEPEDIGCKTSKTQQAGKCVTRERCGGRMTRWDSKPRAEDLCYRDKGKDYYCCPERTLAKSAPAEQRYVDKPAVPEVPNVFSPCTDPDRKPGFCVPFQQCDHLYKGLKQNQHSRNLKSFLWASECPSDVKKGNSVCCAVRSSNQPAWIQHPKAKRLGLATCGPMLMNDNILGGSETALGAYPWMANLVYRVTRRHRTEFEVLCGGTLIHPRFVLTAAHCVTKSRYPSRIRLGEHDTARRLDCVGKVCAQPAKEYAVEKIISHKDFRRTSADHDIALIRLYHEVRLFPGQVATVCLPLTEHLLTLMPRDLTVVGWGQTEHSTKSNVALETDVTIVDRRKDLCPGEGTFCVRGTRKNGSGHCKGDSGGPYQRLQALSDSSYKYVQVGVISAGLNGQCANGVGVGVSVGYHIDWILDNMNI